MKKNDKTFSLERWKSERLCVHFKNFEVNTLKRSFRIYPVMKPVFLHSKACGFRRLRVFFFKDKVRKALKASVISFFNRIWKAAGRKFLTAEMIMKTFAAFALSGAGGVAAIAIFKIMGDLTIHIFSFCFDLS